MAATRYFPASWSIWGAIFLAAAMMGAVHGQVFMMGGRLRNRSPEIVGVTLMDGSNPIILEPGQSSGAVGGYVGGLTIHSEYTFPQTPYLALVPNTRSDDGRPNSICTIHAQKTVGNWPVLYYITCVENNQFDNTAYFCWVENEYWDECRSFFGQGTSPELAATRSAVTIV
ncbi:hypothetical protein COCOBI_18-3180 [Coccomyxa sp. Obi]|nr:hypothetical protein COCOBI_18-3180 [Coccomyxa sp. Obi]